MSDNIHGKMIDCGFIPPGSKYIKRDPRGLEYGQFQARELGVSPDDTRIRVVKLDAQGIQKWACTFDEFTAFACWAEDYT